MSQQRGYLSRLVVGRETVYGTAPATGTVLPFNTCNLVANRNQTAPMTITGSRNPVAPIDGNLDVSGDIVVPIDLQGIGHWLRAMFGAPTTTGTSPNFTHVFKITSAQPSLTIERQMADATSFLRAVGCKVSRFSIQAGGDGELIATIGIMGKTETRATSSFVASPATLVFNRLQNFQAALLEGGSALATATEMSLDLDMGLDGDQYVIGGGGARGDLPEGIISVTGNLTTLFTSGALLDKAIASTVSSLKTTFTSGTHSLALEVQELQYGRTSPTIDGPQGVRLTLPYTGFLGSGAGASAAIATLVNNVASYA